MVVLVAEISRKCAWFMVGPLFVDKKITSARGSVGFWAAAACREAEGARGAGRVGRVNASPALTRNV